MALYILGDSHARSMQFALEEHECDPPVSFADRVIAATFIAGPRALSPFWSSIDDELIVTQRVAARNIEHLTGSSTLRWKHGDFFCFCLGYTMVMLLRHPQWLKFSPWSERRSEGQRQALSDQAIQRMGAFHQRYVIGFYTELKRQGLPFLVLECPPPREDEQIIGELVDAGAMLEINRLAREGLDEALANLGVPVVRAPNEIYQGEARRSFLKPEFHTVYKPGDTVHTSAACGRLLLENAFEHLPQYMSVSDVGVISSGRLS